MPDTVPNFFTTYLPPSKGGDKYFSLLKPLVFFPYSVSSSSPSSAPLLAAYKFEEIFSRTTEVVGRKEYSCRLLLEEETSRDFGLSPPAVDEVDSIIDQYSHSATRPGNRFPDSFMM